MNEALHAIFAIKPNPTDSNVVIFEQSLRNIIPRSEDTHITTTKLKSTPELYPESRNFDANIGVYINYPDDCTECTEYYNNMETRLDYFGIEKFMNDGGIQRLQDLILIGIDGYSGDMDPTSKHTILTSPTSEDEYIIYKVYDNYEGEWAWILYIVIAIVLFSICIWASWDYPLYHRRPRPSSSSRF